MTHSKRLVPASFFFGGAQVDEDRAWVSNWRLQQPDNLMQFMYAAPQDDTI
jgi:hypothetical protein